MAKKKKDSNQPNSKDKKKGAHQPKARDKKSKKASKKKIIKKRTVKKGPSEWSERKPVVLFAVSFLVICLLFYLITNMAWFEAFRAPILLAYSTVSAAILNIFGFVVQAKGEVISSADFSVSIEEGCDAIAPAILYIISVAIFPIATRTKWKGILYGLLAIAVLNVIRIVTLFLTGIYAPSLFEFMHVDFWQAIFIVFTVGLWIYWMRWATTQVNPTPANPIS